jgi:hypothetical protein
MNKQLFAAAKEVEITPPVGSKLEGYSARTEASCGIHDPLMAAVLVFQQDEQTVAWISLDYLAINAQTVGRIREAVANAAAIPAQNVLVACIHTHAAPVGLLGGIPLLHGERDTALEDMLVRKLAGAASWAKATLQPAQIRIGRETLTELGKNRNNPDTGPLDSQLTVLTVEDMQGELIAVWANYGCHPTVLGFENLWISADYPGAAREALKKVYPGMVWVFMNGASGDISTRFTRRGQGFSEVRRFGHLLAGSVMRAIQLADPIKVDNIKSWIEPVSLPVRVFPSKAEGEAELKRLNEIWQEKRKANAPASELRIAQTRTEGAQAQLVMAQAYGDKKILESEIQMMQLGDFALVTLPGEPFTRTVLDIKNQSPFIYTSIVSYGNDYRGYFPDEDSVKAGTYEALVSPFVPGAAEILRDTALRVLNEKGIKRES